MKVLVIEDDRDAAAYIVKGLSESGYVVDHAAEGRDGLFMATDAGYDALIIDRMLPGMDGLAVIAALRAANVGTPVLILSAMGAVDDRVKGLRAGGDDYLVKPFAFSELLARLRSILRRRQPAQPEVLRVADLTIDPARHRAERAGAALRLTPKEFAVLALLARNPGRVFVRTEIAESVWGVDFDTRTNVVDVVIRRLRLKVDRPFGAPLIHTVRGTGYVLEQS